MASGSHRDLAYHDDLLAEARVYCKEHASRFGPEEVEGVVTMPGREGTELQFNRRWIYYHLVEHFAGHYGQINLLRHLYKATHA